jgi:hypothetical protein
MKPCSKCRAPSSPLYGEQLCRACYRTETGRSPHWYTRKSMKLSDSITKNDLERQYVNEGMSLEDIATRCKCSRQYILKLLRRYTIPRRNKSAARILATSKGKITVARMDALGNRVMVPHVKRIVHEDFFKQWTPQMAWVLGVIYTDGCLLRPHGSVKGRLTLSQKRPELIEKVLTFLNSNAKLLFTPKRGITGAVHRVSISNAEVYQDLEKLGVTPRKSLSLTFPEVPAPLVRHFIRGCWDGDGSVYWDGGDARKPCASFVSGSKEFIEQIVKRLVTLGLPDRTIHKTMRSRNVSYYFRYTGPSCARLYRVFYDGIDENMYLSRKHERFRQIGESFEVK